MADRSVRVPLSSEQEAELKHLLGDVPQRTVIQYDWTSEQGQTFIKTLRAIQLTGVPVPWIAEALGTTRATLNGAIGYYQRASAARGSVKRLRQTRRRLIRETGRLRDQADA